ncbi:hypothetical protein [Mitsuokella jalaludinii]|uniref:hypothetical protein n=1 Tax=Mitsuokella jalaludinii TaxID=187979 RepID=UPI003F9B8EBE
MAKAKPAAMTGHKVSADAAPAKKAPRAKEGRERIEAFASVKPSLPRVTGEFADLDDWNDLWSRSSATSTSVLRLSATRSTSSTRTNTSRKTVTKSRRPKTACSSNRKELPK